MSSVAFHHNNQIRDNKVVKLFEGYEGYGNGEQKRDFIYVDDVVNVNLWFMEHPEISGIFNCGTGRLVSGAFNDIARSVIDWHRFGEINTFLFRII